MNEQKIRARTRPLLRLHHGRPSAESFAPDPLLSAIELRRIVASVIG